MGRERGRVRSVRRRARQHVQRRARPRRHGRATRLEGELEPIEDLPIRIINGGGGGDGVANQVEHTHHEGGPLDKEEEEVDEIPEAPRPHLRNGDARAEKVSDAVGVGVGA